MMKTSLSKHDSDIIINLSCYYSYYIYACEYMYKKHRVEYCTFSKIQLF